MMYYAQDMKYLINHGYIDWEKFCGKRIIITGSTGMIGKAVTDLLMMANEIMELSVMIYALARNEKNAKKIFKNYLDSNCFQLIIGDVCNYKEYPQADYLIHAAGYGDPCSFANDPVGVMQANLCGTGILLEYIRKSNARMLFVSTGEVYGDIKMAEDRLFTGNTEEMFGMIDFNRVRSCYPESKRAAETLCQSYVYQYQADVVIGRLCHIYGQTMTERDSRVIAQFFRSVVNREEIILKSDGKQIRSMCYVVDAAGGILKVLSDGKTGEAYNIADSSSSFSIREIAEKLSDMFGIKIKVQKPEKQESRGFSRVSHLILNSTKLRGLGWLPYTGIQDGMKKTIYDLEESR